MSLSLDKYIAAVNEKLDKPTARRLMQFGSLDKNAVRLRDETGMTFARDLVLQSARHLMDATDARDGVAQKVMNFSATDAGYSTVADVKTVGAIDITMLYMANSLVPYVCVDRSLDDPTDTVFYNDLVSISPDGVGGVDKGEIVNGNFRAPNLNVDLGSTRSINIDKVDAKEKIEFKAKIVPSTFKVELKDENGVAFVGQDFAADGTIFFRDVTKGGAAAIVGKIDYETGHVDLDGLTAGQAMVVSAERDMTADSDGTPVLRVTPDYKHVDLVTEPRLIVVEDSMINKMYMKKIQNRAGSTRDLTDDTFARTKNTTIEYINTLVLNAIKSASPAPSAMLDLSTYDDSKFVATKGDRIQLFINSMRARFLAKTGVMPTSIITGSYGVTLLSSGGCPWTPNADLPEGPNGLAGFFDGIPVFRHNAINNATPTVSDFYLTYKAPDNSTGTAVFGEFLPLTSTGTCNNFKLPFKMSEGFFMMNGVKVVCPQLIIHGQAKLPASYFSGELR